MKELRFEIRRKIHQGLLVIMAALSVPGLAWAQSEADQFVLGMRDAFRRGDSVKLTALLPQMRGHVLEPLVSYWESRSRLETATAADMRSALARHPGTYWEDRLRNDWLLQLGKKRDWANFSAELPLFRMNDDRQVQCYALMLDAVERRKPAQAAADQVLQLWLQQRDADDGCATAAQAFLNSGHLKPAAAWERARLTLELGRTRAAVQAVELLDPEWAPLVETIAKDPAKYLDEKITAIRPRTKELVTLAMIRLASKDPAAAALEMDRTRWKAQLTQEERSWVWGVIGKRSAQRLQSEALTYYANGQDRYMHGDLLEWKVRAALRAGAWGHVLEAIGAMNAEQQRQPDWIYWRARAIEALKQPDATTASAQANALFSSIASSQGFYEQLAQEALGRPITVPPAPSPLTPAETDAANRHPGLQRALAAMRLGLRNEGVREWNYIVKLHTPGGMGERELLAAARLACDNEIWDRCINTSELTTQAQDYAQRFPMPHQGAVVKRAAEIGLDPAYVYGLIRQESRFITDARSGVGASGLMQVMPATARWTAKKIGLTDFKPYQINERDTNITIGTAYLKLALDDFEGSLPMAAAAYNAGPNRPRAWREGPVLPGEIWAENIPFDETRDYVKRVLSNTTAYAAIVTGQPQSLRARLGTVGPRLDPAPINRELP
jgi:soluble lytic murein transglycosylase